MEPSYLTDKLFSRINELNKKINDLKSSLQMQKNAQMYKIQELEKKKKTIAEAYKIQEKQLKNSNN